MRSNGTFNDLLRLYDLLLTNIEYFILFLNYYRVAIKLPDVKEAKIYLTLKYLILNILIAMIFYLIRK